MKVFGEQCWESEQDLSYCLQLHHFLSLTFSASFQLVPGGDLCSMFTFYVVSSKFFSCPPSSFQLSAPLHSLYVISFVQGILHFADVNCDFKKFMIVAVILISIRISLWILIQYLFLLSLNCPLIFHFLLQNYSMNLNANGNAQRLLFSNGNWHIYRGLQQQCVLTCGLLLQADEAVTDFTGKVQYEFVSVQVIQIWVNDRNYLVSEQKEHGWTLWSLGSLPV